MDCFEDSTSNFDSRSSSFSRSNINSSGSISKLILAQNFNNSFNSVSLTYFDRKEFFLSISKIIISTLILVFAIFLGNCLLRPKVNNPEVILKKNAQNFQKFAEMIQKDYYNFIEENMKLKKSYPEILNQAADEFNILDGQLTDIVGQVYRIQRDIVDERIN